MLNLIYRSYTNYKTIILCENNKNMSTRVNNILFFFGFMRNTVTYNTNTNTNTCSIKNIFFQITVTQHFTGRGSNPC